MMRIAVIGCGVVGSSWALVFARAGHEVALFDPSAEARESAFQFLRRALDELNSAGLSSGEAAEIVVARVTPYASLEEALAGVDYVQESLPERLALKIGFYRELADMLPPAAIIGSSTSGLPASSFTEGLAFSDRCLVVHPINPPHLIPLVEIVPSPWTSAGTVATAVALMRAVGQTPIALSREINGFIVNRLQSAVLAEAFRLVDDGICDTAAVDHAMKDGLGLRWFFMGPFETIDLNAANGVAEYCRNLGPMYHGLAQEQADPRPWSDALVARIEGERRSAVPAAALADRRAWRDRVLAGAVAAKSRLMSKKD